MSVSILKSRRSVVAAALLAVGGAAWLLAGSTAAGAQEPEVAGAAASIVLTADQDTVVAGDDIDYHVTVTNTGIVALTGVEVIDPAAPACSGPLVDLAPEDEFTYDCSYTTVDPDDVGTYPNAAVVISNEGALALSDTVETTVEAPLSELTVVKSADETDVVEGDDIHFHVEVTNSGNQPLTGVGVTDASVPACDSAIGAMAPDAVTTIDCTYTTTGADVGTFSNIAAAGSDQTAPVDSNQVDVTVAAESFGLDATLAVDQDEVVASEDLDYHLTLENTGNRPLTGLVVTDAAVPDCEGPVADLAAGATTTVDCTYTTTDGDVGTFANSASVDSNELTTVDSNEVTSTVIEADPSITIDQDVDQTSVFITQDIDLHITLENTGNQTLTGIQIVDFKVPDCAGPVPDLAPGASTTIDCTHQAVKADAPTFRNTAAVDTTQTPLLASNQISVSVTIPTCGNLPVNVSLAEGDVPTNGNDVILGTPGPDVINGMGGVDRVCGLGGADVINGGSGNDQLFGMNGDDEIHGGSGNDYITGDGGGGINPGEDVITGDGGADYLDAGNGADQVDGGPGNDTVLGYGGDDVLEGGDGNDYLDGFGGRDTITGGAGADSIFGGPIGDTLEGGDGNDSIVGQDGSDTIRGGAGTDTLVGGNGTDLLLGDGGDDNISGQVGNDTARGGPGNDAVQGGAGNDTVRGSGGNDVVFGDAGNDRVFGDAGIDRVLGGPGNDRLSGGTGQDGCFGDSGFDVADATCDATAGVP
ncbi:MAG: hypothetical protein H6518_08415 [Microthrixaceae bacterium]|nr:hypothetical protein [Microthrixaceae bacterium]